MKIGSTLDRKQVKAFSTYVTLDGVFSPLQFEAHCVRHKEHEPASFNSWHKLPIGS